MTSFGPFRNRVLRGLARLGSRASVILDARSRICGIANYVERHLVRRCGQIARGPHRRP